MNPNMEKYQYSQVSGYQVPTVGFSNNQVNMPPIPPGAPIMMQQWMPTPYRIPGCPPGLEYLTQINKLVVKQKVEVLEAFTGWETNNQYAILNAAGQQVYFAFEESDTCMRLFCGASRSFIIHIVDNMNREVLRVSRQFKCCAGCSWFAGCSDCCAHEVQISLPSGEVLGYVKQEGSCFAPSFKILDSEMKSFLSIKGPCCTFNGPFCPCENNFEVIAKNGSKIGQVSKIYSGFVQEIYTDADNFCIEFPIDLHVNAKATLTGALFLIDFMFFEHSEKK